jgi:uncharacterized protein (TIGR02246 family)
MLKTHVSRILLIAGFALIATAGVARAADPALDKLAVDFKAAWAKADVHALGALYTENAVRLSDQGAVVGRAEIEKAFTTNFAGPWKGTTLEITIGRTESVGPDVSVNEGTFEVLGAKGPDGKPVALKGSYLNTIVKKGGAWIIASNAAFPSSPPPTK